MHAGPRPLVVVAEGDPTIRTALEKGLSRAGCEVHAADTCAAAWALADKLRPQALLTEVTLPGADDGAVLCRRIREHPALAAVPVVFISEEEGADAERRAEGAGASAFLRKPFEIDELVAVLERLVPRAPAPRDEGPGRRWGDWVDPRAFAGFKEFLLRELRAPVDRRAAVDGIGAQSLPELGRLLSLPDDQLARYAARYVRAPYVPRILTDDVDAEALSRAFSERNHVVAVRDLDGQPGLVLTNPFRFDLFDALGGRLARDGRRRIGIASPDTVSALFDDRAHVTSQVPTLREAVALSVEEAREESEHPVLHLADDLLRSAVAERASDIHVEPKDDHTIVRFRIDGDMQSIRSLDANQSSRLISRFKALAGMDIAERRKPQDGSVEVRVGGVRLKLRLATSSTSDGETLIVRLLEPSRSAVPLEQLGMTEAQVGVVTQMVNRHQGLVLVVGPTGSGKSTTIFSMLSKLDGRTRSIMSVEDPVEYRIPFANQQQVNEKAGITFEALLRSAVRQDPDVLFLGEIRDPFSARATLDFASSGHLTVSTLHTANASTAVFRLERLGVQRTGIADSILGVVAQRLIKKVCPECRDVGPILAEERRLLADFVDDIPDRVARPRGCPACRDTGYRGREAVYEVLRFDATLSEMVRAGASINQIRSHAIQRGDFMMFHHAVEKVRQLVCSPRDAYENVLMDELRFRQATDARQMLGLDGVAATAADDVPEPRDGAPRSPGTAAAVPSAPRAPEATGPAPAPIALVVDDDRVTTKLVQAVLEAGGYRVSTAADGVDALLALGQADYDLVVSDINMPNLGGLELVGLLQRKGIDVPVLFMTADSSEGTEASALAAGGADFVRKPINPDVLLGRARNALRGRPARTTA